MHGKSGEGEFNMMYFRLFIGVTSWILVSSDVRAQPSVQLSEEFACTELKSEAGEISSIDLEAGSVGLKTEMDFACDPFTDAEANFHLTSLAAFEATMNTLLYGSAHSGPPTERELLRGAQYAACWRAARADCRGRRGKGLISCIFAEATKCLIAHGFM